MMQQTGRDMYLGGYGKQKQSQCQTPSVARLGAGVAGIEY